MTRKKVTRRKAASRRPLLSLPLFAAILLFSCATSPHKQTGTEKPLEPGSHPWETDNAVTIGPFALAIPRGTAVFASGDGRFDFFEKEDGLQGSIRIVTPSPKPRGEDLAAFSWRFLQKDYSEPIVYPLRRSDGVSAVAAVFIPLPGKSWYGMMSVESGPDILVAEFLDASSTEAGIRGRLETFFLSLRRLPYKGAEIRIREGLRFSATTPEWYWLSDYRDGFLLKENREGGIFCGISGFQGNEPPPPPGFVPTPDGGIAARVFFDNRPLTVTCREYRNPEGFRAVIAGAEESGVAFSVFLPKGDARKPAEVLSSPSVDRLLSRLCGKRKGGPR